MERDQYEQLVREAQPQALRLAHSYLKDWEEARDAVQEAFVKAYRKRASFRGDASPRTWFYRILVNHLKDRLRKRKVRELFGLLPPLARDRAEEEGLTPEPADPAEDPSARYEGAAFTAAADRAMESLPARQREVCRLHLGAGLTLAETARTMGITEGAVKAHYFRAVRVLRDRLQSWKEA